MFPLSRLGLGSKPQLLLSVYEFAEMTYPRADRFSTYLLGGGLTRVAETAWWDAQACPPARFNWPSEDSGKRPSWPSEESTKKKPSWPSEDMSRCTPLLLFRLSLLFSLSLLSWSLSLSLSWVVAVVGVVVVVVVVVIVAVGVVGVVVVVVLVVVVVVDFYYFLLGLWLQRSPPRRSPPGLRRPRWAALSCSCCTLWL